jgi:hypothetical protein
MVKDAGGYEVKESRRAQSPGPFEPPQPRGSTARTTYRFGPDKGERHAARQQKIRRRPQNQNLQYKSHHTIHTQDGAMPKFCKDTKHAEAGRHSTTIDQDGPRLIDQIGVISEMCGRSSGLG